MLPMTTFRALLLCETTQMHCHIEISMRLANELLPSFRLALSVSYHVMEIIDIDSYYIYDVNYIVTEN